MINKILVAIDGSRHAELALDVAADIAEKYDAELVLLHVVADPRLPEGLRRFAELEHVEGTPEYLHYKLVAEKLVRAAEQYSRKKGLTRVTPLIAEGDPAQEIITTATDKAVNLIVMGSRGLTGVKELLLGSVSHKVTQLAPCSCMTVK